MTGVDESAELFAKEKYGNSTRQDGILYLDHLKGTVTRLKSLGVSDPEVLAAAWLNGTMDETGTTFDNLVNRFGSRIAVLVLALSRDKGLARDRIDRQYIKTLKDSSTEAKMIKLCDISTSLKGLKNSPLSRTRKIRIIKKEIHYLVAIKQGLSSAKNQYPAIENIMNGINETVLYFGQRQVTL